MKVRSLFWHNVEPDSVDPDTHDGGNPRVSSFLEQIRFIIDNYTPISIQDFVRIVAEGRPAPAYSKPPVLLGFDDGFRNVIAYALPILEEFNIPAVFFLLGGILKNPGFVPWYVEVKHLVRRTGQTRVTYGNAGIDLTSGRGRSELRSLFSRTFKAAGSDNERELLLTNLAGLLNVKRPVASDLDEDLQFVGWEDVPKLNSTALLTVASHAMTHRNLSSLSYQEQLEELAESNRFFSEHFSCYYPVLSYPDGSFNRDTVAIAKHIYKFAFAVFLGSSFQDNYAYPRHSLCDISAADLQYTLSPFRVNCLLPVKKMLHYTGIRLK